jgi:deoxyribodipyrimidine photo-lyase
MTPDSRVLVFDDSLAVQADGDYVLYWMVANRRARYNFALQRASEVARQLGRPLLVVEPLRVDYRWASERLHAAVLQGMADNAADFAAAGVAYHPVVEPSPGAHAGMLAAFAERACVVISDDSPVHFLPRWRAAAAAACGRRLEAVDSYGLFPLRATPGAFATAHAYRRFLQGAMGPELSRWPEAAPLSGPLEGRGDGERLARGPRLRWPAASPALLRAEPAALAALPIDHTVKPVQTRCGASAARVALRHFLGDGLARYGEDRADVSVDPSSGLSPHLHFGHIGVHEIVGEVLRASGATPTDPKGRVTGKKTGWWGLPEAAELFLDELVTWRELGAVTATHRPDDHDRYTAVPEWARAALAARALDARPVTYDLATLDAALTHDALWNAAQRQLRREGRMHNYMRMLWGKKVLEWSPSPEIAFESLTELNNRYALDGRDPNSASGISWCFGHYDRPWGPRRPIFGTVRYMSSENTRRKMDTRRYEQTYSA